MAIEFVQMSPAAATTGAIVAADLVDFGTATNVSVQVVKFGYGTDGVYNEIATGQGLPVATGPVYNIQQMATATSPVSVGTWTATSFVNVLQGSSASVPVTLLTLPTTATLPVTVATNVVFAVQQMSTATSPVNVTTWSATAFVSVLQGTTVTIPVSMSSAATIPVAVGTFTATGVHNVLQLTTSTSPVSVGTWTATGVVFVNQAGTATLLVSVNNTATIQGNVGGRWAHDATSTGNPVYTGGIAETTLAVAVADGDVVQTVHDVQGRIITMPFSPRGNVLQYYTNVSGTATANLATGSTTAGRFKDLIGLVVSNAATTTANLNVKSSSTATVFHFSVAGDGGGHQLHPSSPWLQAVAATDWILALATQITGKLHISAQFHETT